MLPAHWAAWLVECSAVVMRRTIAIIAEGVPERRTRQLIKV